MKRDFALLTIAGAAFIATACQSGSPSSADDEHSDSATDSQTVDTTVDHADEDSETGSGEMGPDTAPADTQSPEGSDPPAVEPEPIESVDEDPCEPEATAACADLDPGFPQGQAVCSQEGAWSFDDCYYGEQKAEAAGAIQPVDSTKIRFLLDGSKIEDQMYIAAHSMDVLPKAVFSGHVGEVEFPPPGAGVNMTYGWHMPTEGGGGQILILQYTNKGMMPASPMVQMIFLTDELFPGAYSMGEDVAASVIALDNKTQSQCVLAVAYGGSVIVSEAENTSKKQGGKLTFRIPHPIHLYSPGETTFGDLTGSFEGIDACE